MSENKRIVISNLERDTGTCLLNKGNKGKRCPLFEALAGIRGSGDLEAIIIMCGNWKVRVTTQGSNRLRISCAEGSQSGCGSFLVTETTK